MWPNPQETVDLITFTEEVLNRKLQFCAMIEVYEIRINIFYDAQESRFSSNIRGSVKKIPQLQNRFTESWKLCLNLCSHNWLRPSRSLVINLITLGLRLLKIQLAYGLIIFRILFLKKLKLFEFLVLWSPLFHSMIVNGNKDFFKKRVSCFKERAFIHTSSNITRASSRD